MKKCYIAGKISDLPIAEYTANFKNAALKLESMGFNPVNPVELNHDHDKTWLSYMREDLSEMLKCDALFAMSNYKESKGAQIEISLAINLGIPVIFG